MFRKIVLFAFLLVFTGINNLYSQSDIWVGSWSCAPYAAGSNNTPPSPYLEKECGNVGSLWNTSDDEGASNGQYLTIEPGNKRSDLPDSGAGATNCGSSLVGDNYIPGILKQVRKPILEKLLSLEEMS